jgi:hypothetical protein
VSSFALVAVAAKALRLRKTWFHNKKMPRGAPPQNFSIRDIEYHDSKQ